MISEDRIRSMTKLAVFEEGEGKNPIRLANYTKGDYRALQIIKYFVTGTISFMILLLGYGICCMSGEDLDMSLTYLSGLLIRALIIYVIFIAAYMTIGISIAMRRFHRAKKEVRDYKKQLKDLSRLYDWELKVRKEGTVTHMNLWDPEKTEE